MPSPVKPRTPETVPADAEHLHRGFGDGRHVAVHEARLLFAAGQITDVYEVGLKREAAIKKLTRRQKLAMVRAGRQ